MTSSQDVYDVRPRKDKRNVDLISDVLPFGRLWYRGLDAIKNAINYAKFYNRSDWFGFVFPSRQFSRRLLELDREFGIR